jgi:beta-lactamase regulating signal transducer with metallopeptidase domain
VQFFPIADAFRFAQAAAPIAINALWQGAAVAAALSICLRFAPRVSSAHRFAAWAAGFAVVAGLPLLPLISHLSAQLMAHLTSASSPASAAALTQPSVHPWLMLEARWSLAIAVLWAVASAFRAAELLSNSLRLRRLWKSATPIKSETAASLAGLCGDHRITICTTGQLDRPSVIGFFAPRILIPGWLFPRLSREELEQVVLHEAEHLRRRDDWTNLLQKLCLVMFPLNPALVFLERRLCREREMACDEAVVRRTRAPRAYAACLASMAERGLKRRAEALSLGAWERRPEQLQEPEPDCRARPVCRRLLRPDFWLRRTGSLPADGRISACRDGAGRFRGGGQLERTGTTCPGVLRAGPGLSPRAAVPRCQRQCHPACDPAGDGHVF